MSLERDGAVYRGRVGNVGVVAMLTTMGMPAGAAAAQRILELGVDWVMVVGVAGGVDHTVPIGSVVVPEVVLDRDTGATFRPSPSGDIEPRGVLSCSNELFTAADGLAEMERQGVIAVDMETAAVAAVCEKAGTPWSVFRGISDYADSGLVDDALFAMTRPDGTADPDVIGRYLEQHPERLEGLAQLAHDSELATEAAAAAAVRACATLPTG
jgi:nucleoside phosphorylase